MCVCVFGVFGVCVSPSIQFWPTPFEPHSCTCVKIVANPCISTSFYVFCFNLRFNSTHQHINTRTHADYTLTWYHNRSFNIAGASWVPIMQSTSKCALALNSNCSSALRPFSASTQTWISSCMGLSKGKRKPPTDAPTLASSVGLFMAKQQYEGDASRILNCEHYMGRLWDVLVSLQP